VRAKQDTKPKFTQPTQKS